MAKKPKLTDYFTAKDVTPSSLQEGNLITFSYKSPNGVHDKAPMVYVIERQYDRIYGLNLHYDMQEFNELLEDNYNKINQILEKMYFSKFPDKRKTLKEKRLIFDKQMIDAKDLSEFRRRVNRNDIEKFKILNTNYSSSFRCYLYSRMNKVSKLTWIV